MLKPIHDSDRFNPAEGARSPCSRRPCHSKDTQKLKFRNVLVCTSGTEEIISCVCWFRTVKDGIGGFQRTPQKKSL